MRPSVNTSRPFPVISDVHNSNLGPSRFLWIPSELIILFFLDVFFLAIFRVGLASDSQSAVHRMNQPKRLPIITPDVKIGKKIIKKKKEMPYNRRQQSFLFEY